MGGGDSVRGCALPVIILLIVAVPEVSCPRPESRNGTIIVMWTLVHTGGLPLTNLSVTYSFQQGLSAESKNVSVPGGTSARSITVSNLVAGEAYIFNVTAENMNGSSTSQCEGILHEVGELLIRLNIDCQGSAQNDLSGG